jgi:hypothetical protein
MPRALISSSWLPLLCGLILLWLSTGTVNPYASTFPIPVVDPHCGYLYNPDHEGFRAPFLLLDGAPESSWIGSENLKRLLYPLLAYPAMKLLGFEQGGVLLNLLLFIAGFAALSALLARLAGPQAAMAGRWLFATFPGNSYWIGLPYSYACIMPFSVFALCLLAFAARVQLSFFRASWIALSLGVLCLAYDLFLPVFVLAFLVEGFILQRPKLLLIGSTVLLALPTFLLNLALKLFWNVNPLNPNTGRYVKILSAYLHPPSISGWFSSLADLPLVFIHNFFAAGFIFLPLVVFLIAAYRWLPARRIVLEGSRELSIALAVFALGLLAMFIVVNAAPPYRDMFQIRGTVYARMYAPLGVVLIAYLSSIFETAKIRVRLQSLVGICIFAVVLLNSIVVSGPYYALKFSDFVYSCYYGHGPLGTMSKNLSQYGVRPLGRCRPTFN